MPLILTNHCASGNNDISMVEGPRAIAKAGSPEVEKLGFALTIGKSQSRKVCALREVWVKSGCWLKLAAAVNKAASPLILELACPKPSLRKPQLGSPLKARQSPDSILFAAPCTKGQSKGSVPAVVSKSARLM